jgi:UDP-N-acetyl-2-amino-2-deoxyglucuronate dehydrogenase
MTLDVAIVGCGIIGAHHAEAIGRHPRLRVAALVDARVEAAEGLAARLDPRPPVHPSLAAALAARRIDLVAVCTPSGLHVEAGEQAIAAGAHLLVEKPLDAVLPRARAFAKLAAEAEGRGLVCAMVSQHRFDPAMLAVRAAIGAGRLGRVTSAVASMPWWRDQAYYDSAAWRGTWAFDGGGALANQGVHVVDQLLALLGRPAEVSARTALACHERIEVEDVAVATVGFAGGALAVLHATTAAHPGLPVRIAVHGTAGSAILHDDQLEHLQGGLDVVPPGERYGAPKAADAFLAGHLRQYDDIVEAIDTGRRPGVRVEDGLLALALVRTVYVSATLRRPVSFDQVLDGAFDDLAVTTPTGKPDPGATA